MGRHGWLLAAALAAGLLAGCGGPKKYKATGKVTWNGADLPNGHILFEPEDGKAPGESGTVKGGKYEVMVTAGKKRVRINASREVPGAKVDPAMGAVPREAYVPARYNAETELRAEVKPEGPNTFDFPLTDKGPPGGRGP